MCVDLMQVLLSSVGIIKKACSYCSSCVGLALDACEDGLHRCRLAGNRLFRVSVWLVSQPICGGALCCGGASAPADCRSQYEPCVSHPTRLKATLV